MSEKQCGISIVIPVYNIEKYVGKCIESVLNQTFTDYEVLLIDDGSTDNSGSICDAYEKKSDKITVCHKENGGLSHARNFGLERAKGKYVLFVDGDDTIYPNACEELYRDGEQQSADVVIGTAVLSKPSRSMERYERIVEERFQMHRGYTGKEYLTGCLEGGALRVDVWRNLFRRAFLIEQDLWFKNGIAHEDEEFTPRMLLKAQKVVLTDCAFYGYNNNRAGSIMNSTSMNYKKAFDKMSIYNELLDCFKTVRPRRLRRLLEDDISWKYIDCYVAYKMNELEAFQVDRFLPFRSAYHAKRRIKALIFAVSPDMYVKRKR